MTSSRPQTTREVIKAWDYRSRHESLADAKAAIAGDRGGNGGVIVERPKDMFHIYKMRSDAAGNKGTPFAVKP